MILFVFYYSFQEKRLRVPTERLALNEEYSFHVSGEATDTFWGYLLLPTSFLS
ncbi:transcriptional regulator [Streptococcus canis]|uniref:Transcriptional regulator n=1 Tax=Streptococcus canis FSL Z3-227 TaxID=482234 RepID=A0AAV3FTR7_STRCB|nr:hypothetical protein [Streptococcus canis]EIQ82512.1 putative transcriptional regulator [Streptococcus canis FSL Z3-227]